jgi:hypothetical protein
MPCQGGNVRSPPLIAHVRMTRELLRAGGNDATGQFQTFPSERWLLFCQYWVFYGPHADMGGENDIGHRRSIYGWTLWVIT